MMRKIFNRDSSVIDPSALIEMIDELLRLGYEFIGGFTDRGMGKMVNTYVNVRSGSPNNAGKWVQPSGGSASFLCFPSTISN